MRAVLLDKPTSSERTRAFHYEMFHGLGARKGVDYPMDPSHYLGRDLSCPLEIQRSGTRVPDVFSPALSMVVSEAVAKHLRNLPNVLLLPVRFDKLVDVEYVAGDFSFYDRPRSGDAPRELIQQLPDEPRFRKQLGPYCEVVVPWHDELPWNEDRESQWRSMSLTSAI